MSPGQPLDGDAQQHEIDVGINRWALPPDTLQDEGSQRRGLQTIGVERLDRGQVGLVAEALTERQFALRRSRLVLPQVGNCHGQSVVQPDAPLRDEMQDRGRREQDLGQGRQVKPRAAMHWRRKRFALRQTEYLYGTVPRRRYNAQSGAGDASGDRQGDGTCRGGKDFGCSHGGNSSGSVMALPLIQASADRAHR